MNTAQKTEAIELLKEKFSQYSNFYVTNTESLSVAQISKLRRACFEKNVEMKVAKNTLIKKALESLNNDIYAGIYDSLNGVTALMFSDVPKEPAVILSSFRDANKGTKPELKAALIGEEVYVGDTSLLALKNIKTKNELIGEVIGLLQSPISRVISALENKANAAGAEETPVVEETPAIEAAPEASAAEETPAAE